MSFTVSAAEFSATAAKVAALNVRAAKAGIVATATLTEIARELRISKDDLGFERVTTVVEAEITGLEAVTLGDWNLVAVIDHDEVGNIFRTVPGFAVEIPAAFRETSASRCDHCNAVRNRNNTILVWNATEGFKQVGSDCVKLFLGVSVNSLIAFISEIESIEGEEFSFGGNRDISVRHFVAAAALTTEVYGFKPASFEGQATKRIAYDLITLTGQALHHFKTLNPELVNPDEASVARANSLAEEAVAWIATQTGSEYITNLRIAAAREDVGRNSGLLASLPNAYKRFLGEEAERAAKVVLPASQFVGREGGKVTVKATPVYTNRSEGYVYGSPDSLFIILLGDDGSKFFIRTTVATVVGELLENAERGTYFEITGTVKEHKVTDKDEQVTVLTRCKAA